MSSNTKIRELEFKLAQAKADLERKQEQYRNDPAKLARAIAKNIRRDELAQGKYSRGTPADRINNGGDMHWYQKAWGQIKQKDLVKVADPIFGGERVIASCATTGCVAGWTTSLAGFPMVVDNSEFWDGSDPDRIYASEYAMLPGGGVRLIPDVATDLLSLNSDQRNYLFAATRTREEVLDVLDKIGLGILNWDVPEDGDEDY